MTEQPALYVLRGERVLGREPSRKELLDRIDELERALHDAELDLRRKRAQITQLRGELDERCLNYDRIDEVQSIFSEWREVCGHPNARIGLVRVRAIRGILEVVRPRPYPREAFSRAIQGAAHDPYVTRRKNGTSHVHDDIALICRDESHFEEFIKRAPQGAT